MAEKSKNDTQELRKKSGLTGWIKGKLMGEPEEINPVDTQFLADLSDIRTVGRYEIIGKLGQGSMGVVYLGKDHYINRNVSIKISRPAADVVGEKAEKYRRQFFMEAQSAGSLLHPNIMAIYDAGLYKDFCYITMEYIDGPNLVKFCQKDSLMPLNKVVEIVFTVCKAFDFAHKKGIVHRDIKPSNIMMNKAGDVKITDFGIASIKSEQTASKGIIGSPSYMSPEQVKEEPLDAKSDIFSLGCVLYELLTGAKAFMGDNCFAIMYKIINEESVPLRNIRPEIPEVLESIIKKALAKDPSQRYQTCMDFAYDLRVALRGLKESTSNDKADNLVDYIHSVSFFENFTKDQVKEILNASAIIKTPKNKVVVTEGEIDDAFFIILSGKAAVHKYGKNIAMINRGECFGEMAYLSGQSRMATVIAETDCIMLKISATLLDKSSEAMQLLFLKNFAFTLMRRLSVSIKEKK